MTVANRVLDRLGFLLRDRETRAGRATNAALYVLNTAFLALYVLSTYPLSGQVTRLLSVGELVLAVVFLGEYVVRVYSADDRRAEVTNPYTVVDIVAVLPVLVAPGAGTGFLRGLHALRVFRFLRLLVGERQVLGQQVGRRAVRRVELSVTIFLIFFIATGFVYAVEHQVNNAIGTFGDAFYYTVIAVSTVGFGDIVPVTAAGRWVTVAAVLVGFVVVPWQAARLRDVESGTGECNRCAASVETTDRYCHRCGAVLLGDPDAQQDDTDEEPGPRQD